MKRAVERMNGECARTVAGSSSPGVVTGAAARSHDRPCPRAPMIKRDDCIRLLAAHHTDEIVVPLYQAAFEWHAIKPWPLTYYAFGAMGQGSSHGLGMRLVKTGFAAQLPSARRSGKQTIASLVRRR